MRHATLSLLASFAAAAGAAAAREAETPPIGFDALVAFDQLPLLTDWPAYQDSSYHRDNINQDAGNFLRVEPDGDQVLTDTDGPGCIYRLWSTGVVGQQMSANCRLRLYLERPTPQAALPALAARLPRTPLPPAPTFQCCSPAGPAQIGDKPLEQRKFSDLDAEYESKDAVWYGRGRPGQAVDVTIDVPGEDRYAVVLVLAGGDWVVGYGLTYIWSPDERTVACFVTKDDGLKIWVNDAVAFDKNAWSHAWTDQFYCTMKLTGGWNKVLVKSSNWFGAWAFALRLGDPEGSLRFARRPGE